MWLELVALTDCGRPVLTPWDDMTVWLCAQYNNTVTVLLRQASAEAQQIKQNAIATVRFGTGAVARSCISILVLLLLSSHTHKRRVHTKLQSVLTESGRKR
jgi:hypothetical protein